MEMAGAAGAAAAAQKKKQEEEEEKLTDYRPTDLEGWEFKIVRSAGRIRGEKFEQLLDEEAVHGWELVEKFDDYRVRFKRRIENRSQYRVEDTDPYRTTFGLTDGRLALIIILVSFGVVGAIILLAVSFSW
jgi:hypothetical protein